MNIQKMMKQAQQMQSKMAEMQAKMEEAEFSGESGSGMVKATINGKGYARALNIDPSLVVADDKDMLEDLVIAAFNDAKQKAEDAMASEMGAMTDGLSLPPGMKLPF